MKKQLSMILLTALLLLSGCANSYAQQAVETTVSRMQRSDYVTATAVVRGEEENGIISADLAASSLFSDSMQVELSWVSYQEKPHMEFPKSSNASIGKKTAYHTMEEVGSGSWSWSGGTAFLGDKTEKSAQWAGSRLQGYLTGPSIPDGLTDLRMTQGVNGYTIRFSVANDSDLHKAVKSYLQNYIWSPETSGDISDISCVLRFNENFVLNNVEATFDCKAGLRVYQEFELHSIVYKTL